MKPRNGFVSNSSSSSFIIYRKLLTEDNLEKIQNWWNENEKNIHDDDGAYYSGYNRFSHNFILARCHSHSTQFSKLLKECGVKEEDYMMDYR